MWWIQSFTKKTITLVTLSQFQLVCENFAYLRQPGDFDLHCGGLEETNTQMTGHAHGRAMCWRGQRHDEQQIKYLNHVNNFSATAPQFEFPHISFHVLGDPHRAHLQRVLFNSSHLTRLLVEQVAPTNDTLVLRLYPEAGFEAVERHPVRIVFISAFAEEQGVVVQEEMSLHWLEPGHLLHSDRCSLMADPHIEASLQDHPTQLAEVTLRQRKHKQGGGTTLRVTALFTEDSFIFSHTRRVSRCKHIKDLKTSSLMVMLAFKFHTDWSHAAITLTRGWIWDKSAQLF